MANQEILNYLEQFKAEGKDLGSAKQILLGAGWAEADIDEAMRQLMAPAVAPSPTPVQSQPTQNMTEKVSVTPIVTQVQLQPRKPFNKVLFAVIVVALVLVAGGAYAYYVYFAPSPEAVFESMVQNLKTVKTTSYKADLKIEFSGQNPFMFSRSTSSIPVPVVQEKTTGSLNWGMVGSSNLTDVKNPKVAANFNVDIRGSIVGGSNVGIGLDLVVSDGVSYLRLNKADLGIIGEAFYISKFADPVKGRWIKADPKELASMSSATSDFSGLDSSSVKDLANLAKVTELFKKYSFLKVKESLPDEAVDGENTYHYKLDLNRDNLTSFIVEFGNSALAANGTSSVSAADVRKQIDNAFTYINEYVKSSGFDIWISKNSKLPKRVLLTAELNDTKSDGKLNLSFDITYSGFNNPVDIKVPEGAESLAGIVLANILKPTPADIEDAVQARDQVRIADLNTIKSAISLYLADVSVPHLCDDKNTIYASAPIIPPKGWKLGKNAGSRNVDGTGWIPVKFTEISSGAPISKLPVDPINDPLKKLVYLFACGDPKGLGFEVDAVLESERSRNTMVVDGGDDPAVFEIGIIPGLKLIPKGFWNNKF